MKFESIKAIADAKNSDSSAVDVSLMKETSAQSSKYEACIDSDWKFSIQHALIVSFNYGLSLMLMLVAMTYNPSLFVALVFGWGLGDFFFYRRTYNLKRTMGLNYSANTSCH